MRLLHRTVFFVVACAFTGQALAALFDDEEARRRIELLRQSLEAQNRSIDERLAKIELMAGDKNALLEFASQMEQLRNDVAGMRGQVEVLANQAENLAKRQTELYQDIDTRLLKLERAASAQSTIPEKPAAQAAEPEVSAAETRAYQAALDQFKLGNYSLAVAAMQGFLVTYPSSALAPNAQYWIGMAHSGQRDYKNAIAAQRKLLAAWPDSQKAPDAMLSIASAQETMGDRKSAQKTLEELVGKYPTSSAATSAKQRLAAFTRR
jgi:tol-pal system protein YbgF